MNGKGRKEAGGVALGSAVTLLLVMLLSCLALIPQASAETHISGLIEDTHWTVDGSPYIIVDDAFLSSEDTLVIDPGVEVMFNELTSLHIWGRVVADASEGESILFTSSAAIKNPGDWESILLTGQENIIRNARIEYGNRALYLEEEAFVSVQDTQVVNNHFAGIYSTHSSLELTDMVVSENSEFGIYLESSAASLENCSVVANGISLFTTDSSPVAANSTVQGTFRTLVVAEDSHPRFINSPIERSSIAFEDEVSTVSVEWFVTVEVKDVYSSAVPEAEVLFSSNLGSNTTFWTDDTGEVENVAITEATLLHNETLNHNPYLVRASKGEQVVDEEKTIEMNTFLELYFSVDLEPPKAFAGENDHVDEDVPYQLDASGSTDNEPDFLSVGTFIWEFTDQGSHVKLEGLEVTYTFETPDTYHITLTARDSRGNEDKDSVRIWVRDTTPPSADAGGFREVKVDELVLLDAGNCTDNDPDFWRHASFLWIIDQDVRLTGERVQYAFEKAGNYSITLVAEDSEGNSDSDTINVLVKAPAEEFPLIIPTTIGIVAIGLIGAFLNTEVGKFGLFKFLLIPLYVKLKKDDILDQFLRGQIYGYIKVHPGENYSSIKRNLQLNNGTLTYHLDVLIREGLIVSRNQGSKKIFYPVGIRIPDNGAGLHAIQEEILERVTESPGLSISDLARLIGISRQLTNYHVKKLVENRRLAIERRGVRTRCFLSNSPPRSPF